MSEFPITGPIAVVNNTGCDISDFDKEIFAAIKATGTLPEELQDIFVATRIEDKDGSPRWRLDPA